MSYIPHFVQLFLINIAHSSCLKMGLSIQICSSCTHFRPDALYPEIGYCSIYNMESIFYSRRNQMWCGPNATDFERAKQFY